jgi:hypothetical protein
MTIHLDTEFISQPLTKHPIRIHFGGKTPARRWLEKCNCRGLSHERLKRDLCVIPLGQVDQVAWRDLVPFGCIIK